MNERKMWKLKILKKGKELRRQNQMTRQLINANEKKVWKYKTATTKKDFFKSKKWKGQKLRGKRGWRWPLNRSIQNSDHKIKSERWKWITGKGKKITNWKQIKSRKVNKEENQFWKLGNEAEIPNNCPPQVKAFHSSYARHFKIVLSAYLEPINLKK